MNKLAIVLCVALALAACGGGGGGGGVTPQPSPPVVASPPAVAAVSVITERRGANVFEADWSQPSIGLTGFIDGPIDGPLVRTGGAPDALYLTLPRPGGQGLDVVDPGPNAYYHTDGGRLYLHSESPGFPIITSKTFPVESGKTLSFQASIGAKANAPGAWGGIVVYNVEANWRSIYYSVGNGGRLTLGFWGPGYLQDFFIAADDFAMHDLRIDYKDGTWKYYVDGRLVLSESGAQPLSTDPTVLYNDPHLALFMGELDLVVGEMNVVAE